MNDVTFQRMLESVMLDNKYDRYVKNRRTGKLNTKGLYKVSMSSRLFKRREARLNKHYAISLVVDISGSMSGSKLDMAIESAKNLSKHLASTGIQHSIVGFGSFAQDVKPFSPKFDPQIAEKLERIFYGGEGAVWAIYDNTTYNPKKLLHKFVLREGQNPSGVISKFAADNNLSMLNMYTTSSSGDTSTGEAIMFAREKILKQQGRKIIILLSDGMPSSLNYESPNKKGVVMSDLSVKKEVDATIRAGVDIYSVGIQSDAGNKYFPPKKAVAITDLEQLYPHIIKLIRLNLKRG